MLFRSGDRRNAAKRLINLVDALYDCRVKIVASVATMPEGLWTGGDGAESFEFARTISRLTEMRSEEYAASPHLTGAGEVVVLEPARLYALFRGATA